MGSTNYVNHKVINTISIVYGYNYFGFIMEII